MLPALPPVLAISLGPPELILILVIVLLLFGATKIPELARNMGRAKAEFKRGEREGEQDLGREQEEETLRRRAQELGIPTEGKSLDELRAEVARRTT